MRDPLTIDDVPPGSVFREKGQSAYFSPVGVFVTGCRFMTAEVGNSSAEIVFVTYAEMVGRYEIKRPDEDWTSADQLLCVLPDGDD